MTPSAQEMVGREQGFEQFSKAPLSATPFAPHRCMTGIRLQLGSA